MKSSIYTRLSSCICSIVIGFSIVYGVMYSKVLAQTRSPEVIFEPITTSIISFGGVVNTATLVAVGLVFLFFFYNLAKYISKPISAPGENQKKGKNRIKGNMVYSLIVIVVISSLWGLIAFIRAIFGLPDTTESGTVVTGRVELETRR